MKVLDLFSGIGGFSLGLERAGMTTVAFCEIDPFCRRVLRKHWPETPIHEDIRSLDGTQYRGTVDVVCGGFPCQPYSHAGKQRGSADDRHLWPEMLRVIREVEPRFVAGENVVGLIKMELDSCLSDLETLGYACGAFVVPACAVDAHHRRDRVWILADRDRDREPDQSVDDEARRRAQTHDANANANGFGWYRTQVNIFGESEPVDGQVSEPGSVRQVLAGRGDAGKRDSEDVAHAHGAGERREGREVHHEFGNGPEAQRGRNHIESGPLAHCRWVLEPPVGRVVDGLSSELDRRNRLRALGNAVVPQVVEQIGLAIMEAA